MSINTWKIVNIWPDTLNTASTATLFEFTGANGSTAIGLQTESGTTGDIQNNKLNCVTKGNWGGIFNIDTGDPDGLVEADLTVNTDVTAGVIFRCFNAYNFLYTQIRPTGVVEVRSVVNGVYTTIDGSYTIPSFITTTTYNLRIEFKGTDVKVFLDGVLIYILVTSVNLTSTKHGVRLNDGDGTADNVLIGTTADLPAVGNKPTLTVSGSSITTLAVGDAVPTFTVISATDVEDGALDIATAIQAGDTIDNTTAGTYVVSFTIQDSDGNFAVPVNRTIVYTAVPTLEITGRTEFTIKVDEPFNPPVARVRDETDGVRQVVGTGWTGTSNTTVGVKTITYEYTNTAGIIATPLTVTVTVDARTAVTTPSHFSYVSEFSDENIVVDGYNLTRYTSGDGESYGYGFADTTRVPAIGINLINNATQGPTEIGRIKIPFDTLNLCKKTSIFIEVDTNVVATGATIQVAFGDYRTASQHKVDKDVVGAKTILEFELRPYHDSNFRITGGGLNAPTRYLDNSGRFHDWGLSSNTDLVILMHWGNTDGNTEITAVNAYADVGASKFGEGGAFLNGADSLWIKPFRPDDSMNKGIPSNPVVRDYVATNDKVNLSATHLLTVAGDDWVTVGDVTDVRIGDLCVLGEVYHDMALTNDFRARSLSGVNANYTREKIGNARYVAEIDAVGKRIRMSETCLTSYDSTVDGIDSFDRYVCLITMSAEQASLQIGHPSGSWTTSLTNGTDKSNSAAINYASLTEVIICENDDPIKSFEGDRILQQNNWIDEWSGPNLAVEEFGEVVGNNRWAMPTASTFDGTTHSALNADRNYLFITPDKRYGIHTYLTNDINAEGQYRCSRYTAHDLSAWSVSQAQWRPQFRNGQTNGSRAAGISAACMLRKEELDVITYTGLTEADVDNDLDVAENAVQHMIVGYLGGAQLKSHNFSGDLVGGANTNYYAHELYNQPLVIVDGGSNYAVGDVLHLACILPEDTHSPTIYTVESVNTNGEILKVFCTRTGQHKTNCASVAHFARWTSGAGTGANFNTVGLITNDGQRGSVISYPSGIADTGYAYTYAGAIPMGAVFTIHPSINLRAEWRAGILRNIAENGAISNQYSYEFFAVCKAIQDYGWVVNDVAYNTSAAIIYDDRIQGDQRLRLFDSPYANYANIARLRNLMAPLENFTPTHHLATVQDFKPDIDLIGPASLTVRPDWEDMGAETFSKLHGYQTVTATTPFNPSLATQTLSYNVTDASGNTSDIVQRTITVVDIEAGIRFEIVGIPDGTYSVDLYNPDKSYFRTVSADFVGGIADYVITGVLEGREFTYIVLTDTNIAGDKGVTV